LLTGSGRRDGAVVTSTTGGGGVAGRRVSEMGASHRSPSNILRQASHQSQQRTDAVRREKTRQSRKTNRIKRPPWRAALSGGKAMAESKRRE
jgi:hypothetical protein